MRIEVRITGVCRGVISVRRGSPEDAVKLWNDILPRQVDDVTGWAYEELWRLGNGPHDVQPK